MFLRKIQNKVISWKNYRENREILEHNLTLKNQNKNKRCFIIGTGPSINKQNLVKLRNEETIAVNSFWNYPQYKEIDIKYHLFVDKDVFSNKLGSAFKQEIIDKNILLGNMSTSLFFHIDGKKFIEGNKLFINNKKYYLSFMGTFKDNLNFNIEPDKILPNPKNVIVCAIELAAYMGFTEIYLLGCEHSFLTSSSYYKGFEHFYSDPEYDLNNPEDVKKYALVAVDAYESRIWNVGILFKNYRLLKNKLAVEKPNLKIFNATSGSFLDVFPFVNFENIKFK
jgi:hypothetical protein